MYLVTGQISLRILRDITMLMKNKTLFQGVTLTFFITRPAGLVTLVYH